MLIVKQFLPNQFLVIIRIDGFFQFPVSLICLDMHKRPACIIKPAVKHHQAEHKSLRIRAEIRLPEPELIKIEPGTKRLFIKTLFRNFFQNFQNRFLKFRKLFLIRIFRHD